MTHGFNRPVLVILDEGGASVRLAEERVYTGSQGDSWTIPAGFTTDFATIPAVVSWAIPKLGAYTSAAIVHDLLCEGLNDWHRVGGTRMPSNVVRIDQTPRPTADARDTDAIFRKIGREFGVDPVTSWLLWTGVRWGALANPARRSGWLRDAPLVLLITLLALIPVGVPTVFALAGRGALRLASWLSRTGRRLVGRRPSTRR